MLEISTLSSPEIVMENDQVIKFVTRKALALVVYLAVNPGSCSREKLADLLWSDRSQERATGNLRVVLSDVRKKIGDYLSINRNSVSLSTGGDVWVDVHHLLSAIEDNDLDLAVSLYRGDFLESFYVKGASRFENWQVIEREKIRLELVDGLSEAVHLLLKTGRSKEAIKYLVHLTTLEPLLESAHRQLMQAYFENGELSLALRQFEICKQMLSEELSVTPAEDTLNLYYHVARHRSLGELPYSIPHNLLNFKTPFIGQKGKTRELLEILSNSEVRFLSLVGPGGYGKSRMAIHLAKKCLDQFPDGVFLVPLQTLDKSSDLPIAISDAMGFIHQTEKDIKAELLDYLKARQTLLVLDNFEHLLDGAKLVSEILTTTEKVKLITTSRQKLNLKGETTYIMRGMDYPTDDEPAFEWSLEKKYDAIQLFINTAVRTNPSFKPKNEGLETIARICKLVEGMPLAIELAAGWVPILSLRDIEAEINKGFGFLEGKLQDVEERHRSLQAVVEGSWSMLTDAEKSAFKKLSILKGPFTRSAAERIAGADVHDLLSLSNKSFLQKDSEGLLRIHEWLREFGESMLRKFNGEYSETLVSFSNYYANHLSESWWEAWSGECQLLRLEWRNISDALMLAARTGDFQQLGKGLLPYFFAAITGEYFNESATFFVNIASEVTTQLKRSEISVNNHNTYALCLALSTFFLEAQSKHEKVKEIYGEIENLVSGKHHGTEYAWIRMIENITNYTADWKRRHENAKQALEIFIEQKDDYAITFAYNLLAIQTSGNMKRDYCQKALYNARKHNGTTEIAWALLEFGRVELEKRNYKKADAYLSEAYSRNSAIQFSHQMVNTLRFLGTSALIQGNYSKTREYCERAVEICEGVGLKRYIADCNELLAAAAVGMKDFDLGRKLFQKATTFWIDTFGNALPFGPSPIEIYILLEHLGRPDLAVMDIVATPYYPIGELWKEEYKMLLEEFKTRYSQEEMSKWIEKAGKITPIELTTAIRDAMSDN